MALWLSVLPAPADVNRLSFTQGQLRMKKSQRHHLKRVDVFQCGFQCVVPAEVEELACNCVRDVLLQFNCLGACCLFHSVAPVFARHGEVQH